MKNERLQRLLSHVLGVTHHHVIRGENKIEFNLNDMLVSLTLYSYNAITLQSCLCNFPLRSCLKLQFDNSFWMSRAAFKAYKGGRPCGLKLCIFSVIIYDF